jgi:hypothetical protein
MYVALIGNPYTYGIDPWRMSTNIELLASSRLKGMWTASRIVILLFYEKVRLITKIFLCVGVVPYREKVM